VSREKLSSKRAVGAKAVSFWTRYSVDDVPGVWKPLFWIYSYFFAVVLFLYFRVVRLTSRVTIRGQHPDRGGCYFFTCWHDRFPIYLAAQPRQAGQVWMVLPAWYMKPMHLLARWSGVEELVHGATGYGGREAQKRLVAKLTPGRSTVFLPDGPFSNPREPCKGILYMSIDSGLAIVPMKLRASRAFHLRTWDQKAVPLPFSRIEIQYGTPIRVKGVNEEALEALRAALND
jgi:lysophospholipid acyltransferase (LPLAT)-like uncharacterized protein